MPAIDVRFYTKPYRRYTVNGIEVPSVTTVIGILDKPALVGWAANETIRAVCELAKRRGEIPLNFVDLKAALEEEKLGHYWAKTDAADRGLAVHDVWEAYGDRGEIPVAARHLRSRRGYINGLTKFLVEHTPEFLATERIVGSAVHGFAGRLDSVVRLRMPDGRTQLIDVKTSKRCYFNFHIQVEGYEIAHVEGGKPATDERAILMLGRDGSYEIVPSQAQPEHFLDLLPAYHAVRDVKYAVKQYEKAHRFVQADPRRSS